MEMINIAEKWSHARKNLYVKFVNKKKIEQEIRTILNSMNEI